MTSVQLKLNQYRALKDGTYPLVFQLIHLRDKKLIYTPYKLFSEEFDSSSGEVHVVPSNVRDAREVRKINRKLKRQRRDIESVISALEGNNATYTTSDVVARYKIAHDKLSLLAYIDMQISVKCQQKRYGMEAALHNTRLSVASFIGSRTVNLSDFNTKFVHEYETYLLGRGVSQNTICYYMRNLKAIYGKAKIEGYPLPAVYPFDHIRSRPCKTVKRALEQEDVRGLYHLDLSERPSLEFARDIFIFCFLCRGMPFVDAVYLKKENVYGGIVDYCRRKTKQRLQVAVTAQMEQLMNKYRNESPYVFPILHGDDDRDLHRQYRLTLERVNRLLKEIGKMCGITVPLTTYVARHSWATLAKKNGAPVAVISEGLGHTLEKTTHIYLKEFEHEVIDLVNERVNRQVSIY